MQQKILLIDQSRQNIDSLRISLENQGFKIFSAYSFSEALHRLGQMKFDLLIVSEIIVAKKQQLFR